MVMKQRMTSKKTLLRTTSTGCSLVYMYMCLSQKQSFLVTKNTDNTLYMHVFGDILVSFCSY